LAPTKGMRTNMKGEKLASQRRVTQRGRGRGCWISFLFVDFWDCENSLCRVESGGSTMEGSTSADSWDSNGFGGTPTGETRISLSTWDGYFRQ